MTRKGLLLFRLCENSFFFVIPGLTRNPDYFFVFFILREPTANRGSEE